MCVCVCVCVCVCMLVCGCGCAGAREGAPVCEEAARAWAWACVRAFKDTRVCLLACVRGP